MTSYLQNGNRMYNGTVEIEGQSEDALQLYCSTCGTKRTTKREIKQLRSADEGISEIYKCSVCNTVLKITHT